MTADPERIEPLADHVGSEVPVECWQAEAWVASSPPRPVPSRLHIRGDKTPRPGQAVWREDGMRPQGAT